MNQLFNKIIYGGGLVFNLSKWLILLIIIFVIVNSFWFTIFIVDGQSMEPSLHDGEVVLLNKSFIRRNKIPQRGDAVVVKYPGDPENKRYVKRVIALPNEFISIKNSRIYINNELLRESYISINISTYPEGVWQLKEGEYFLMGDNRENSNDSRYFGPVEERFFIGKAEQVILPSLRTISLPNYQLAFKSD